MRIRFLHRTKLDAVQYLSFTPTPELEAEVLGLPEPKYSDDDEELMVEHELDMAVNYTFEQGQEIEVESIQKTGESTFNLHLPGDITAFDCDEAWFEITEEKPMNSLMVIHPYLYQGIWVFDDETVGLDKEALVAGVPEIMGRLCEEQGIEDPQNGFSIVFSAGPFPGYHLKATWLREGDDGFGNWYSAYDGTMEGWLCPALFKYFDKAPENLYLQVKSRSN